MLKHLGVYLGHYAGVLAGACAVIAGYNPSLISSILPFLGPHAAAIVGGAGAIVTALHAFGIDPPKPTAVIKALLPALVLLPLMTGCASTQAFLTSPTGKAVVTDGVAVAIIAAEAKGVTAAQINTVAKSVLAADQGASASLSVLASVVNGVVLKAGVPPTGVVAFQILEAEFNTWLVAKYGSNAAVQNVQADVAAFCQTVIADTGG